MYTWAKLAQQLRHEEWELYIRLFEFFKNFQDPAKANVYI